ncbi:MAG: PAS domain S-box protein [Desulfobacterales bacterium]
MKNNSLFPEKDTQQLLLIVLLVSVAFVMVYYFHAELRSATVFTHFFYIPIILASIWWTVKGPVVALCLGASLILSHIFLKPDAPLPDDLLRALMFIVVSVFVIYVKQQNDMAMSRIVASEKKFRELFENIGDGVCIYRAVSAGRDFVCTDVNKSAEHIEGMAKEEMMDKSLLTLFPEAGNYGLLDVFHRVRRTGKAETLPLSHYKDDRISGWRIHYVYRLSPEEIVCVYRDETERKKAEMTSLKLEDIVQSSNDAIVGISVDGIIQTWNRGAREIFGYEAHEAAGNHISLFVPRERIHETFEIIDNIKKNRRVERFETVRKRKDGKMIQVSVTASPVKNSLGAVTGASIITRDITEKSILEEQVRQAQKRQAIGTLAAGIAHDFNNILMPIIGFSELSLDLVPRKSPAEENLRQILKSAERARELIQHILTFSRESRQERQPVKLQYIVKEALKLIRATLPSTIRIRQEIHNCSDVLADPTQIHQIVMNLCTNAYHAMEENGGTLEISLTDVCTDVQDCAEIWGLNPGKYVQLRVRDTGHGIDPSIMPNIFDPYFTTKEEGKGTGLGLAVVQGIVKNHGGKIKIASTPGSGTCFEIYFPQIEEDASISGITAQSCPPRGSERVLLVDDEEQIVQMLSQMLRHLGYQVTDTSNSLEALKIFSERPDAYDLVITDQTMPDMTGFQLAQKMREIRPGIPVVLCTGFSSGVSEKKAKESGIREFIMKPVVKKDLAEALRRALDAN